MVDQQNLKKYPSIILKEMKSLQVLLDHLPDTTKKNRVGIIQAIANDYFKVYGREMIHFPGMLQALEKNLIHEDLCYSFLVSGGREAFISLQTFLPIVLHPIEGKIYPKDYVEKVSMFLLEMEVKIWNQRQEDGSFPHENDLEDIFMIYYYAYDLANFFRCSFATFEQRMEYLIVHGSMDEKIIVLNLYDQYGRFYDTALPLIEALLLEEEYTFYALPVLLKYAAHHEEEYNTPEYYDKILPDTEWLEKAELGNISEYFLRSDEIFTVNLLEACWRKYSGIMNEKDKISFSLAQGDFENVALLLGKSEGGDQKVAMPSEKKKTQ